MIINFKTVELIWFTSLHILLTFAFDSVTIQWGETVRWLLLKIKSLNYEILIIYALLEGET